MSSYIDSSVFIRRYARERVGAAEPPAVGALDRPVTSRITQVEVLRFLGRADSAVERSLGEVLFAHELGQCEIIELDAALAIRAAQIAAQGAVKSLDAIHLAAAERAGCVVFVTGDRRQGQAASALGMRVMEC